MTAVFVTLGADFGKMNRFWLLIFGLPFVAAATIGMIFQILFFCYISKKIRDNFKGKRTWFNKLFFLSY